MKRRWRLAIILFCILLSGQRFSVRGLPTNFLIKDGQLKYEYEHEHTEQLIDSGNAIEWKMCQEAIEETNVTNVSQDTVRFTTKITLNIVCAYQKVNGTTHNRATYGYRYWGDPNFKVVQWFNYTNTHTISFVQDVSKITGTIVRTEYPAGVRVIDALAYYDVYGGLLVTSISGGLRPVHAHSTFYCENSTSVKIGDPAMGGVVSHFAVIMGRDALIVTPAEVPPGFLEFTDIAYYDKASGLDLYQEIIHVTSTSEVRWKSTLTFQTVLEDPSPTSIPSLPEFIQLPTILGLIVVVWNSRRSLSKPH